MRSAILDRLLRLETLLDEIEEEKMVLDRIDSLEAVLRDIVLRLGVLEDKAGITAERQAAQEKAAKARAAAAEQAAKEEEARGAAIREENRAASARAGNVVEQPSPSKEEAPFPGQGQPWPDLNPKVAG